MNVTEVMTFGLNREIGVEIEGQSYTLKEASGDTACKYRSMMVGCMDGLVDGKPSKIHGRFVDCDPFLVSLCLYNGDDKLVPLATIKSWPSRYQNGLCKWIKDNSDLQEGEQTVEQLEKQLEEAKRKAEAAKNDLST